MLKDGTCKCVKNKVGDASSSTGGDLDSEKVDFSNPDLFTEVASSLPLALMPYLTQAKTPPRCIGERDNTDRERSTSDKRQQHRQFCCVLC